MRGEGHVPRIDHVSTHALQLGAGVMGRECAPGAKNGGLVVGGVSVGEIIGEPVQKRAGVFLGLAEPAERGSGESARKAGMESGSIAAG